MAYSATQLQLTHVLQQALRRLGGKVVLATGGSITTAIDTKLAAFLQDSNEDDTFNDGIIIVIKDAGGAAAAPEGEFSAVTDYVASTTTLTFSPAITTAIAAGDRVLIGSPEFPLYDVVEVVNDALKNLGEIPLLDKSITTAANQTEYTLPLAVKGDQLLNVEIQGTTVDADDNRYEDVPDWKIVVANPGSTGLLVIPQYPAGYIIRITYLGIHPRVSAYDDYISEYLHPELVHASVMAHLLQWKDDMNSIQGGVNNSILGLEQKAWSQYDRARILYPIQIPPRKMRGFVHWHTNYTHDKFYPIPKP